MHWRLPRWYSGEESACQCRRFGFHPWVGKIPLEKQHTPVFLPAKSHGQRSLVGYSPRGHREWGTHIQLHLGYISEQSHKAPWFLGAYIIGSTINSYSSQTISNILLFDKLLSPQSQMCWMPLHKGVKATRRELFCHQSKKHLPPFFFLLPVRVIKVSQTVVLLWVFQLGKVLLLPQAWTFHSMLWLLADLSIFFQNMHHCSITSLRCLGFTWYSRAIWEINEEWGGWLERGLPQHVLGQSPQKGPDSEGCSLRLSSRDHHSFLLRNCALPLWLLEDKCWRLSLIDDVWAQLSGHGGKPAVPLSEGCCSQFLYQGSLARAQLRGLWGHSTQGKALEPQHPCAQPQPQAAFFKGLLVVWACWSRHLPSLLQVHGDNHGNDS